jgi:lysophospholipase L1-like esterase
MGAMQRGSLSVSVTTLVAFGDSIVHGWGVAREDGFPAQLERLLAQRATAPWRVVNAGVPGDTAIMGCLRYARDIADVAPQIVLIAFGLNDGALRRTRFDAEREELWRARRWPWARIGYVARRRLGIDDIRRSGEQGSGEPVAREPSPRVQPHLFSAGLRWLVRQSRRHGAEPHLASLLPVDEEALTPNQARAYRAYDEMIRAAARRTGAALVDLQRAAVDSDWSRSMLAPDGIHLTVAGQRWLAEAVLDHLVEESNLWLCPK